jgi:hypothetical protein
MRTVRNSFWATLALTVGLFGCQSESVAPGAGGADGKNVAGAMGDIHPAMDSVCHWSDTIYFQGADGSLTINKCGWEDELPAPIACATPQERWGYMRISNGYAFDNGGLTEWVGVEFALPYGWYCQTNSWKFAAVGGIAIDQNTGKPTAGNDWSVVQYAAVRGEWKIALPMAQMPNQNAFELACKLLVSPIDINGAPLAAYTTNLWAAKSSPAVGANPFVLDFTPVHCMGGAACPAPAAATVCKTVYKGLTCSGGTALSATALAPDAAGAGTTPVYRWSNGASTSSITVNPAETTTYTCTVSDGTCDIRNVTFNVNVIDAACTIGQIVDPRAEFCTSNLNVRFNQSFNIRNYVKMKSGGAVNWNTVRFTYTEPGANNQTTPANWKLSNFNAGQSVTALSSDASSGRGNQGTGEYRVYVYRVGQPTYDAAMTIRVSNSRPSNVSSTQCGGGCGGGGNGGGNGGGGNCGNVQGVKICNVPPGNPLGATTLCVSYNQLNSYVPGVCSTNNGGANSGNQSNYLGACNSNPCL